MHIVIETFLTHRQIGESEAFFKIFPRLLMKDSNCESAFVPTGFKSNRSAFCELLPEDHSMTPDTVVKIEGKDGDYTEKPTKISKYERRNVEKNLNLKDLTYLQFCMKYVTTRTEPKEESKFKSREVRQGEASFNLCEDMILLVTEDFLASSSHYTLPEYIELLDPRPGEPKFMKMRKRVA